MNTTFEEELMYFDGENRHPVIGETVEDFEVEIFQKNAISKKRLSAFKGKWIILFFYPADFTFVCPTELEEMQKNYKAFKKLGAEILSVSTDTAFVHKGWHDNSPAIGKIEYPMVGDPAAVLTRYFGVHIPEEGLALRGTFILNPKRELMAYEVNDNSIGRNADELLRKLEAAIYVSKHKNEVCPASWKPGKKTLKPGVDLIGKI